MTQKYKIDLNKPCTQRINTEIPISTYDKLNKIIKKIDLTKTKFLTLIIDQVYDEIFDNNPEPQ